MSSHRQLRNTKTVDYRETKVRAPRSKQHRRQSENTAPLSPSLAVTLPDIARKEESTTTTALIRTNQSAVSSLDSSASLATPPGHTRSASTLSQPPHHQHHQQKQSNIFFRLDFGYFNNTAEEEHRAVATPTESAHPHQAQAPKHPSARHRPSILAILAILAIIFLAIAHGLGLLPANPTTKVKPTHTFEREPAEETPPPLVGFSMPVGDYARKVTETESVMGYF